MNSSFSLLNMMYIYISVSQLLLNVLRDFSNSSFWSYSTLVFKSSKFTLWRKTNFSEIMYAVLNSDGSIPGESLISVSLISVIVDIVINNQRFSGFCFSNQVGCLQFLIWMIYNLFLSYSCITLLNVWFRGFSDFS